MKVGVQQVYEITGTVLFVYGWIDEGGECKGLGLNGWAGM